MDQRLLRAVRAGLCGLPDAGADLEGFRLLVSERDPHRRRGIVESFYVPVQPSVVTFLYLSLPKKIVLKENFRAYIIGCVH